MVVVTFIFIQVGGVLRGDVSHFISAMAIFALRVLGRRLPCFGFQPEGGSGRWNRKRNPEIRTFKFLSETGARGRCRALYWQYRHWNGENIFDYLIAFILTNHPRNSHLSITRQ